MPESSSYLDLSRVRVRAARPDEVARCEQLLAAHHYLREAHVAGDRGWQIAECDGVWVAIILWCAAAKRLKAREAWIGWDPRTRAERLKLIVQQARFCLLRAQPNLASRVLGEAVRHLPDWWQQRHGYTPLLAESFVDPEGGPEGVRGRKEGPEGVKGPEGVMPHPSPFAAGAGRAGAGREGPEGVMPHPSPFG